MPFGKANSSKVFCHWVSNWVDAFKSHFKKMVYFYFVLESYVDDVFGGAGTKSQAANLIAQLVDVGRVTTAVMNPLKSKGPAQVLEILGLMYDALLRRVSVPPSE